MEGRGSFRYRLGNYLHWPKGLKIVSAIIRSRDQTGGGDARHADARSLCPTSWPARSFGRRERASERTRRSRAYVLRVETGAGGGGVPGAERKGEAGRLRAARSSPPPASALKGLDGRVGRDGSILGGGGGGGGGGWRRWRVLLLAPAPAVIRASGRGPR